jgi:hypothetical protein
MRTRAEELLGEWGVREQGTVAWQREGRALELERDGLAGRPLPRRLRPFGVRPDAYVAAVGGVPAHIRRLREIEDAVDAHVERLREACAALAAECGPDGEVFARRWRTVAEHWDFFEVNDLIERHNRWYPTEARLPMDPRTGDFVPVGGRPYRREPLDARWILAGSEGGGAAGAPVRAADRGRGSGGTGRFHQ